MAVLTLYWTQSSLVFAIMAAASLIQIFPAAPVFIALRIERNGTVALATATLGIAAFAGAAILLEASLGRSPLPIQLLVCGAIVLLFGVWRACHLASSRPTPVSLSKAGKAAPQKGTTSPEPFSAIAAPFAKIAATSVTVAATFLGFTAESGLSRPALLGAVVAFLSVIVVSWSLRSTSILGRPWRLVLVASAAQVALGTLWIGEALEFRWFGSAPSLLVLFVLYLAAVSYALLRHSARSLRTIYPKTEPIAATLFWVGGIGLLITHADPALRQSWYPSFMLAAGLAMILARNVRFPSDLQT